MDDKGLDSLLDSMGTAWLSGAERCESCERTTERRSRTLWTPNEGWKWGYMCVTCASGSPRNMAGGGRRPHVFKGTEEPSFGEEQRARVDVACMELLDCALSGDMDPPGLFLEPDVPGWSTECQWELALRDSGRVEG